jgi:hypothetical protein
MKYFHRHMPADNNLSLCLSSNTKPASLFPDATKKMTP